MISITINGNTYVRKLSDMTKHQREVLGEFLGLDDSREQIFDIPFLRNRKKFCWVKSSEVHAKCPAGAKFSVQFTAETIVEPEPLQDDLRFTVELKSHRGFGYCKVCKETHSVSKIGMLVSTTVNGAPFSREYEV